MKKISMISAATAAALVFAPAANAQVTQRLDVKIDNKTSGVKVGTKKKPKTVKLQVSTGTVGTPAAPLTHEPIAWAKINLPKGIKLNYKSFKTCSPSNDSEGDPLAGDCESNTKIGSGTAKASVNGVGYEPEGVLTQFIGSGNRLLIRTQFDQPAVIDKTLNGKLSTKGGAYSFEFNVPELLQVPLPPTGIEQLTDFTTNFDKKTVKKGKKKIGLIELNSCPKGGFKFTGEFRYRSGATAKAETTVSCKK